MEDYIEKIRKLPDERLKLLSDNYRKTLAQLSDQYRLSIQAAMITVADYTKAEIDKKQAELDIIEQIIKERQ